MEDSFPDIEYVLLNKNEVLIYSIPTRPALGHRAENWSQCIWKGKLQLVAKGNQCTIKFIVPDTGQLYAQCPLPEAYEQACESAVDSSRYFAVRLDDGKGRHVFVGLGFESRNDAFDFKASLNDFARRNDPKNFQIPSHPLLEARNLQNSKPTDKIKVNLDIINKKPKDKKKHTQTSDTKTNNEDIKFLPFMKPPPPPKSNKNKTNEKDLIDFEF